MFLIWTSDASPHLTDSMASRFVIGIIPASLYHFGPGGVNMTLAAATQAITVSFTKLALTGIKAKSLISDGRKTVPGCAMYIRFWGLGLANILRANQLVYHANKFQVALLRFWPMGFRGDWKALCQTFQMARTYNHDKVMWE